MMADVVAGHCLSAPHEYPLPPPALALDRPTLSVLIVCKMARNSLKYWIEILISEVLRRINISIQYILISILMNTEY